ncbi:MAG TPA: trypsin-like peptidase domain-containing protein [Actinophytocola sp.]|uniref:trypsin-like peptidase domain-containing protein n=1 Tax=Actinophytocola sp. TaxID=1872138 RepID=UPI002DB9CAE4|nr:trypsin-like peptidase domain-containing protein [Actinophytocola sp.]HEU5469083.1 trypsin-like peptidase domain-containing protein [Actinophytocola sp.]
MSELRSPLLIHPLNWTDVRIRELRDALSATIYRESEAESVVSEAGLSPGLIRWSQPARTLWFDVMNTAAAHVVLAELLRAAARSRPVLAYRVGELLAGNPVVGAPLLEDKPFSWRGTGDERQIVDAQETLLDVAFLQHGLDRARAVCRLVVTADGRRYHGTGFRVGDRALLTNYHVLWPNGVPASTVRAEFGYEFDISGLLRQPVSIECVVRTICGDAEDDFAVIKTSDHLPAEAPVLPLRGGARPAVNDRVYIIQHPKGLPKKIAMHHNLVRYVDDVVVQYWTDTEAGSSGSPVFDEQWRVVALHHRWVESPDHDGVAYRNQGRAIGRVVERLDALGVDLGA